MLISTYRIRKTGLINIHLNKNVAKGEWRVVYYIFSRERCFGMDQLKFSPGIACVVKRIKTRHDVNNKYIYIYKDTHS